MITNTLGLAFGTYSTNCYLSAKVMSAVIANTTKLNRSHIPVITVGDSVNGPTLWNTTLFPASLSMSSSWNIPLFSEVVNAISLENRVLGVRWVYSPELDLAREPKFGRVGEMYGEVSIGINTCLLVYIN